MPMSRRILFFLLVWLPGLVPNSSAAVIVTHAQTKSGVDTGSVNSTDVGVNTLGETTNATQPGFSSTVKTSFVGGTTGSLLVDITQFRAGTASGNANGQVVVDFTTSIDASYSAMGTLTNSAGLGDIDTSLVDLTSHSVRFAIEQQNDGGPFTLNLAGPPGNAATSVFGSLSGILTAGHTYEWIFHEFTTARSGADNGATASGSASFQISAVPEPSSLPLLSLLALTIGGGCRWKRSKQAA
jgi:hypothetical protein